MDQPRKALFSVAAALALLLLARGASGQAEAGAAEFVKGMELYRAHEYAAAVVPLENASRAASRPPALIALGFCYRQLKQFAKAAETYQRYLRLHLDDEKRVLELLERTMAEEREWRRSHPATEELSSRPLVAPVAPPAAPAATEPAPPHGAAAPANSPATRAAPPPALAGRPSVGAASDVNPSPSNRGWLSRGLIIGGGAGLAAGGFFGLRARGSGQQWHDATTDAAWANARSNAERNTTAANVGFIAGGALLAAGFILLFTTDTF